MKTLSVANEVFIPQLCELIDGGHSVSIRARGNSMRPFIENDRDVVVLSKATSFKVGDVALAEISKGHFVLHRIDAIRDNKVRLRGDGNIKGTEFCTLKDLRAVMVKIERKGKVWETSGTFWKIYSVIWVRLLPLRKYLLALYKLLFLHQLPERLKRKK